MVRFCYNHFRILTLLVTVYSLPVAGQDLDSYRTTLNTYCVTCHNETLKTANLMLDKANLNDLNQDPQLWEKVLLKLQTRSMPPVGMPRPDEKMYISLAGHLQSELDRLSAENPNAGRTITAHRLNRVEYSNAVRDLLAVNFDATSLLPADNSGGFDNLGDLLSVSEILMEKYMVAARQISRMAVGDTSVEVDVAEYNVSPFLLQNERMNEDLPFGTRGGIAVRHRFPVDGEYTIKVRLQKTDGSIGTGLVIGVDKPHYLDIRIDGKRADLLTVGGDNKGLAIGAGRCDKAPPDFEQAQYERTADNNLEIRIPVKAGERLIQIAFLKERFASEEQVPPRSFENYSESRLRQGYERAWAEPAVSNFSVTGPYNIKDAGNTVSRDLIFVCRPDKKSNQESCAREILSQLAYRAYRRPVTDKDVAPLLGLYKQGMQNGNSFEAGIQLALEGILVSSKFLFRVEQDPENISKDTNYPITDLELASRLSFFLWSSLPDEELLKLAETGNLHNPDILEKQVRRMLADNRSDALVNNFTSQWLLLRNLSHVEKNQELFPDFDENLRKDLQMETQLFLESIFREDHSMLDLFRADYKFLNERLAKHYKIPGIYGSRFRRVTVTDVNKQGLLAHGSVLSITSYPNRTSPVLRGKWVLEYIMAAPPPPPPTVIPALKESDDKGKVLTMREAMVKHRANPVCAVCHNRMDPIGFGLENFNPIGQWREQDAGKPIDSSGMLPDGSKFQGPSELQQSLLRQSGVIASAFTRNLLTYALGRDLAYYDMPGVREIVKNADKTDYKISSFILGIVNSLPFQKRRSGT